MGINIDMPWHKTLTKTWSLCGRMHACAGEMCTHLARAQLPHEHAKGVDVSRAHEAAVAEKLRGHIGHRAIRLRGYVRVLLVVQRARQPEVRKLHEETTRVDQIKLRTLAHE